MITRAVVIVVLAGGLGGCAEGGLWPSAPEESQLTGPQAAPPSGPKCNVGFRLVLDESKPVRSDGLGSYVHKVDKVSVFTGGEGFRFDSNTSHEFESASDIRRVILDFSGTGYEPLAPAPKGVDFRFDMSTHSINLCALPVGGTDILPASLGFVSSHLGVQHTLVYGGAPLWLGGDDCGARGVSQITVTRLADVGGKKTYSVVSGPTACMYSGPFPRVFVDVVPMPLAFTITAK